MRSVGGVRLIGLVAWLGAATPHARADTTIGVRGGLVPKQRTSIHVRSLDLTIAIDPDGEHYDVSARYLLANAAGETTVRFGVPLLFVNDDPKAPRRAADAVRVKVNEQESRCTLLKETVALDPDQYQNLETTPAGGWCIARLPILQSDAVPVLLTYRTDLLSRDESGESAFFSLGPRLLRHVFFPAGSWVGPAERIAVTVDLGRYAGLEQVISPPGATKHGDKLTWTFANVDLQKLPDLAVKVDVEPIAHLAELATYRKASKVALAAKAAPGTGDAATTRRAVDGDPETSWCIDKPSPDRWIQVTERKLASDHEDCRWQGVFLVSRTSEKTARIKRVRLEACAEGTRKSKLAKVDVPVARIGARGPWGVILDSNLYSEIPEADVAGFVEAFRAVEEQAVRSRCVRVSIIEAEGSGPACVGELMPLRSCG
jgi:hypothetical protein